MKNVALSISKQYGLSNTIARILAYSPVPDTLAYMIITGIVAKPPMEACGKSVWLDKLMDMMDRDITNGKPAGISRCFYGFKDHGFGIKVDYNSLWCGDRQSLLEANAWENIPERYRKYFCPILTYATGKHGQRNEHTKVSRKSDKTVRTGKYILSVVPMCETHCLTREERNALEIAVSPLGINDIHSGNIGRLQGIPVVLDYAL